MDIVVKQETNPIILQPQGRLDASTAPVLSEALQQWIGEADRLIQLDLSELSYISSGGLRVLLAAAKDLRAKNGDLQLTRVQPDVYRVLTLAGFTTILEIHQEGDCVDA